MNPVVLTILLVAFVIISVLLVLLVLVQDEDNSGMGGLLGGGNSQAFGSHSASVLTKATVVFVVLFFVLTFVIAKAYSTKSSDDAKVMNEAASELQSDSNASEAETTIQSADNSENQKWWKQNEEAAPAENSETAEPSETQTENSAETPATTQAAN